ncbi:DUF305 domain-containing protein [Pseudonocardia spinosispora]|uniref:DUF305 domain-containing protein n=1 Tax=Pseudonocardia spinosispora TaxID=103441 RepID=UPI00048FC6DD|nr:DUF305 domain-containing protein [Pseudonocardia spinosispora]
MSTESVPVWSRYLLAIGGAVALLMLGAAAGLLFGLSGSSSTAVPSADSVDVGFAQDMSVHHEQAVQMATWERDHTTDPQLRQLAFDIESGQSRQIGHMQGWLGLWGAAAQGSGPYMTWMSAMPSHQMGAAATPGMARMPGMASDDELRRLRSSTGPALDVLFLQLMLRHHEGGSEMLSYAATRAEQPDVRNLATQMRTSQSSEATYLRALLAARGAAPLPQG